MSLLVVIILVLALIVFLKAKKIKELNKTLLKKEAMFFALYEQRFEAFLKLINLQSEGIQESIFMNLAEIRKESLFFKNDNNNKEYLNSEEKIQSVLKKLKNSTEFSKLSENSQFIEINGHIGSLNTIIEETKSEYNNLIDDFNQETTDFFGKKISRHIKGLKKFKTI